MKALAVAPPLRELRSTSVSARDFRASGAAFHADRRSNLLLVDHRGYGGGSLAQPNVLNGSLLDYAIGRNWGDIEFGLPLLFVSPPLRSWSDRRLRGVGSIVFGWLLRYFEIDSPGRTIGW